MLAHVKDEGPTLEKRRARAGAILVVGLVALALLVVWAVILRRAPIEQDLVSRSAAILETAGIDATDLHFEGREGSVTIEAPLADSAGMIIRALEGVRSIEVTSAAPPAVGYFGPK